MLLFIAYMEIIGNSLNTVSVQTSHSTEYLHNYDAYSLLSQSLDS